MRTSTALCLALAGCTLAASPPPARAQAPQQEVCFIAAYIDYADIKDFDPVAGAQLPGERELVFDGSGQSCCVDLVGTPPNEKLRLTCNDQLNPVPSSPITIKGFDCQVFRGRRGEGTDFAFTTDSSLSVDGQGRATMRCTTQ